ncbi:MAG: deoxynucleoside kinase [Chloroflexi bacterium]|nr:deoxynucleoside kinase [Chloroflexota bacterium]
MKRFVAVAGNIGVGKSTLTALLAQHLGWEPFFEAVNDNPYLGDFYADMQRWGFHSQIYFLSRRLRHHWQLLQRDGSVVQDRTVYEDAEVFACNLYRRHLMDERDYRSYRELYETVTTVLRPPDLIVYLRASVDTLTARIHSRGRPYERDISADYLDQLNGLYEEWIDRFSLCPVLTLPSDDLDFVVHARHLDLIVHKILEKLHGQEEVILNHA